MEKETYLRSLARLFKEWLGELLLDWAIDTLPIFNTTREGVLRGLREQRDYDRYEGYCRMLGERPLPFDRWRKEREWIGVKFASRTAPAEA